MRRRLDPRYCQGCIDAMVLDQTGGLDDEATDRIVELATACRINLLLPHSVQKELGHPNTPIVVKRRAANLLYTKPVQLTSNEREMLGRIIRALRGNARPGKHDSDALHIFESQKYTQYFITNDTRILRKAAEIFRLVQLPIMTPTALLELYDECVRTIPS